MQTKKVSLIDGGVQKDFTITRFSAFQTLQLCWTIAGMFSDESILNKKTVTSFLNNTLMTGDDDDGENNIAGMDLYDLIPEGIRSILNKVDEEDLPKILSKILSRVVMHNGKINFPLSDNIDEHIQDMKTIILLAKEVIVLNLGDLLGEKKNGEDSQ